MTNKTFLADTGVGKIPMILYTPSPSVSHVAIGVCVVMFHGKGELGNGTLSSLNTLLNNGNHANLLAAAEKYGFSVLAPQVSTNLTGGLPWWSDPHIESIIDYAVANHTKLGKVAVTGLSQGGGTVWEALTNEKAAPKIFSGIPICPTSQYGDNLINKNNFALIAKYGIAVWDFHAADDQTCHVANSRNMVVAARKHNPIPKIEYTEYPTGGHGIWGRAWATEEIYPHILSFAPDATEPIPPVDPLPTVDEVLAVYKQTIYKSGNMIMEKI